MKYVIVHRRDHSQLSPIVFPNEVSHRDAVPRGYHAIAAGFFRRDPNTNTIAAYGKSESLHNLVSRGTIDAIILTLTLDYCCSAQQVENLITMAHLRGAQYALDLAKHIRENS